MSKSRAVRHDLASQSVARPLAPPRRLMPCACNQLYTASCDPGVHERLGAEEELRLWGPDADGRAGGTGGYGGT